MTYRGISGLALLALLCHRTLPGQEQTRADEIRAQQETKANTVRPEPQKGLERFLLHLKNERILERFREGVGGFHPKFGGMVSGSGFAYGTEYRNTNLAGGNVSVRASAQVSTRGYQKQDFRIGLDNLHGKRFFAEIYGVHHNYPGLVYYGPQPESRKTGRSNFRLEDTALDATFGARPARNLTAGASLGYVWNNIGPGTDSRFASSELLYPAAQAPGIDHQANFLRSGAFVQYDWRDNPDGPRRGGNYFAQFSDYRDRTFGFQHFRRLDLEAQQYLSVLNQRRVLALRAKSTLTFREGSQAIPFYMQPTLGGSEDLRGYRPFRFRADNVFVMNAEYRWEVFSGLDMALFADAGQAFSRKRQFSLSRMESDAGFGFRFNARNKTFLRLDFGFSHEGFQVWVKFNNIFKKGPVRTSSTMGDF